MTERAITPMPMRAAAGELVAVLADAAKTGDLVGHLKAWWDTVRDDLTAHLATAKLTPGGREYLKN